MIATSVIKRWIFMIALPTSRCLIDGLRAQRRLPFERPLRRSSFYTSGLLPATGQGSPERTILLISAPPLRIGRGIGGIGAARGAMAGAHQPVVARGLGRGRPRPVLQRRAVAREREALFVAPREAYGAQARERLFVEHEFRLAARGRGQRADHDFRPRAVLVEGQAVVDDRERLALRQIGDAAEAVARRVRVTRLSRFARVAVGGQPLLGGEGVEALARD